MANISVILLAGGMSSRFSPLKEKNLYPFLGKTALETHLARVATLNPKKVVVNVNKESEAKFHELVSNLGYKNLDIVSQKGIGMAGGVISSQQLLDKGSELLIIGVNDYYTESLFDNFTKRRSSLFKNGSGAIAAYETQDYFPGGYLVLDGESIKGIVEKPGAGNEPSKFVNMVFHYFPSAGKLINAVKEANSQKDDVYEVAIDNLIKAGHVFKALKYSSEWKSIKYPWHVLDVMDFFLAQIKGQTISPKANISKLATIKGNVVIEEGVKIFEGVVISGPVYLGKNVVVGNSALVRESMIGEGSVIGFATEVARSYFKSNVWLHKNYVGDSIFEDNVSLGSNAITANLRLDENNIKMLVKDELIDTSRNKLGAVVGSNVRVGVSVNTMPGVKIGSGSFVGPGVLLETNLEEKSFVKRTDTMKITKNKFEVAIKARDNIKASLSKN